MSKYESFIYDKLPVFEELLKQFVSIKSISNSNDDMTECIKFLTKLFTDLLSAKVEVVETQGLPTITATIAGASDKTILFYGHYDTMPGGTGWEMDPFELTKQNARYYGRGVGDNKGQLLAQILGLYTYLQQNGELPFNVVFLVEGEEERGSLNLKATVNDLKNSLLKDVELAVVVDGSINESGDHVVRLGNRGALGIEIIANTGLTDNHSGNSGNIMQSAVIKLIIELEKLIDFSNGQVLIPGFYEGVPKEKDVNLALLKKLPFDKQQILTQMGLSDIPEKIDYYRRLMYQPTFNIAGMNGGYADQGIKTIIPHTATAKIDCRLVGSQDIGLIEAGINKVLAAEIETGEITVNYLVETPASTTNLPAERIEAIVEMVRAATSSVVVEPVMAGTVPNYVWTETLKVPVITIPFANYDQHNHAPNENLTVKNFIDGIKISYELINNL